MPKPKPKRKYARPFTLHPVPFEDAVKALVSTPPMKDEDDEEAKDEEE